MKSSTRKVAEELRKRIASKYSLHQFRVFGSSARGDSRKESDIDVWVCLDKLNREIEESLFLEEGTLTNGFERNIIMLNNA